MDKPTWVCRQCGSMNPFSDMICDCGHDGRVPLGASPIPEISVAWREKALREERDKHPEWEKQPGETSTVYAYRMIKVMRCLAKEFHDNRVVTP